MVMRISVFLTAVVLLVQGCSSIPVREWPALEGRVLDAHTEEPIEGTFVVARWLGYGRFSDSQCFHVEVPETDAQGRYRIEAWRNEGDSAYLSDQRRTIMRVHKPGYRESSITKVRESYLQGVYYLEKDEREGAERLAYLDNSAVFCPDADENMRELLPLYKALYAEASKLATTKKEQIEVLYHLKRVEVIEVGSDEAWRRFHERQRRLK